MSKPKADPRFPENYAFAKGCMIRVSPRKLNLVAQMIRGIPVEKARRYLAFSPKRIAQDVLKVLNSAIANAQNNQGLNAHRLVVDEATVGRALVMRRLDVRGRSKSGRIEKPFSHLRIVVCEPEGE